MDAASAQDLRNLVHDCLAKHMYEAAIFFADKLVTFSGYAQGEVYTLAQALFVDRQHRRCLQVLRTADVIDKDLRFRYLAARCLAECKEWEECLELLGGLDIDASEELPFLAPPPPPGAAIDYISSVCLLRGQVYDALENFPRAVRWYTAALERDPLNYEAFQALVGRHKLSNAEECQLVVRLASGLPPERRWVGHLYRARCKLYQGAEGAQAALDALENEPPHVQLQRQQQAAAQYAEQQRQYEQRYEQRQTPAKTARGAGSRGDAMLISPIREESEGSASPASSSAGGGPSRPPPARVPPSEGWGLAENGDVAACRAEWLYRHGRYEAAHALTSAVLERDPYAETVLPVHLAAAVQLGKKNELFMLSHRLMEAHPGRASSWFASGCYYHASRQYAQARRHFGKATGIDRGYAPAWLAFGHAFAAQDESDQAMAAYRSASRLFPGLHTPLLGMGQEYLRMSNLPLAEQMLASAHALCPADPLACNELGVLNLRLKRPRDAADWLKQALALAPMGGTASAAWEPTWVNLGHALRKLRRWEEAREAFTRALVLAPWQPGTHAALGYTLHLAGDLPGAVERYHAALGLRPEDSFTAGMLQEALTQEAQHAFQALTTDGDAAGQPWDVPK